MVYGHGFGPSWVVGHQSWVCVCDGFWFLWVLVRCDESVDGFAGCFCGGWVVVILVDGCDYTLVFFFFFCSSCRGLWLPR